MPWVTAGDISPNVNQLLSVVFATASPTLIAYRVLGISDLAPKPFGYFSWYTNAALSDGTTIAYQRGNVSCWQPAAILPVTPSGAAVQINRLSFFRRYPPSGVQTIRLYYFTP